MKRGQRIAARRGWRGWLRRVIRVVLGLLLLFYALSTVGLVYLRWLPPIRTTVQIQRAIEALWQGEELVQRRRFVSLEQISVHLQHAVIAAEDARFREHFGIDTEALEKVVRRAWKKGELARGGSTITQQLVKNLFLTTHRSVLRKALEMPLAPLAELILRKKRILELYLNVIEWGPGIYGAEAAARHHFGVAAAHLGREQSARLAAIIPAPRRRAPQQMDHLSAIILERMRAMGW